MEERRERGDAIEAFKTLNGFNRVKKEDWFFVEEEGTRPTRRNTTIEDGNETRRRNVLKEEYARLEVRRNFYNVRAAKTWNQIPDNVRQKKSVNAFKSAYDKWKTQNPRKISATDSHLALKKSFFKNLIFLVDYERIVNLHVRGVGFGYCRGLISLLFPPPHGGGWW